MSIEKPKDIQLSGWLGPDRSAPYPVSRLSPPVELVDLARQIEKAGRLVNLRASAELKVVAEQIEALQKKARVILERTKRDMELHNAQCSFKKIPGKTYYLYRRDGKACYFSMLSPEDWKGESPDTFLGAYTLAADMSWKKAEEDDEGSGSFDFRIPFI